MTFRENSDISGIYLVCSIPEHLMPKAQGGECIWELDGRNCMTKESLFDEFYCKLHFPSYFGRNWDAFDECMSDLTWLPYDSHLVIIRHADFLIFLNQDIFMLLNVLENSVHNWNEATCGKTFKVVLLSSEDKHSEFAEFVRQAGITYLH